MLLQLLPKVVFGNVGEPPASIQLNFVPVVGSPVKAIVTADGEAADITVVRGINPGLDQKAIEAISKWTFQPGMRDGKPVAVWVNIEVNFHLK